MFIQTLWLAHILLHTFVKVLEVFHASLEPYLIIDISGHPSSILFIERQYYFFVLSPLVASCMQMRHILDQIIIVWNKLRDGWK